MLLFFCCSCYISFPLSYFIAINDNLHPLPLPYCQHFPRDRRNNEDQKIQPPLQNNLIQDDESNEIDEMEVEDFEPDIDKLDDVSSSHFLTKSEYHFAKNG